MAASNTSGSMGKTNAIKTPKIRQSHLSCRRAGGGIPFAPTSPDHLSAQKETIMADQLRKDDNITSTPGEDIRTTTPVNPGDTYRKEKDENRDPITDAPGAHPVGVGVGAAGAGAAGALIGSVAGPVGSAVGAVVGAVAGGLAGKGVAEAVNPTAEDAYWRDEYRNRPYYDAGTTYDEYAPAYRYG